LKVQNSGSVYIDQKEKEIFLIYKEIQKGSVAKSYMRKSFLIYCMRKSRWNRGGRNSAAHFMYDMEMYSIRL
jgi:hypothetical protein